MKKSLLIFIFICFATSLFAAEGSAKKAKEFDPLVSEGMSFGIGAALGFKSPMLAAGPDGKFAYNEVFAARLKEINIDDFIFGIPLRFDWIWANKKGLGIGAKLDLDIYFMPTGNYSMLTEDLFNELESSLTDDKATTEHYDQELGFRSDLTAMFALEYKIFQLSFGAGVTLNMNAIQLGESIKGLKGDSELLAKSLTRIGLNPHDYTIVDPITFKQELNTWQQIDYYGLHLDGHVKLAADFLLGKHVVVGLDLLFRFNSEMSKWNKDDEFKVNMERCFDPNKIEGTLGFHFVWMF